MHLGNVEKWSGTTQFPSHNSIVGDTLSTFAHFRIQYTHDTMVFADLQTTRTGSIQGIIYVLFDIMTHTISQDSGVSDFGDKRLTEFQNQNKCGARCAQLELKKLREDIETDKEEEN
ncbi:atypical alpha protein kinase [Moniliophthora roreri MCA 2997]|uniref:Atypical alpha protein kinase n=2 Tax=Moniliophthora roreri TaxID=221103 RepID=V2W860_MONRO|nr:atypical alpha protein kinase [Moniliophthora roreri MCA 2997]